MTSSDWVKKMLDYFSFQDKYITPKTKKFKNAPTHEDAFLSKAYILERNNLFQKLQNIDKSTDYLDTLLDAHFCCLYADASGQFLSQFSKKMQKYKIRDLYVKHEVKHSFILYLNFNYHFTYNSDIKLFFTSRYYYNNGDENLKIHFPLSSEENSEIIKKQILKNKLKK